MASSCGYCKACSTTQDALEVNTKGYKFPAVINASTDLDSYGEELWCSQGKTGFEHYRSATTLVEQKRILRELMEEAKGVLEAAKIPTGCTPASIEEDSETVLQMWLTGQSAIRLPRVIDAALKYLKTEGDTDLAESYWRSIETFSKTPMPTEVTVTCS